MTTFLAPDLQSDTDSPANNAADFDIEKAQTTVNDICGRRYKLSRPLAASSAASRMPDWHAFQAHDEFLGRSVVVRLASSAAPSRIALITKLVDRARAMARVNEHLISRTYDAVVQDADAMRSATADSPAKIEKVTHALIVSSYFDGPTLDDLIAEHSTIDVPALIESLSGRVDALDRAGLSLGLLQPDQIVMTEDGPAIAAPPVGSVSEIGPTDLAGVCDSLGVDVPTALRVEPSPLTSGEAKGTMRESTPDKPADTGPSHTGPSHTEAADHSASQDYDSVLADDFYDDEPTGEPRDDDFNDDGWDVTQRDDEPRRNKFVLAIAILLSIGALVVIGWFAGLLVGNTFGNNTANQASPAKTPATSSVPKSSDAASQTGQPIAATGAKLLDPPPGDGQENPDRIDLSYDGNTGTTWPTLQYKGSATFGNLKPGVGIVYDLGSEQAVSAVKISTTLPGATVEIRTGTEPQAGSLDAYAVAVQNTELKGETGIKMPDGTKTQYVVVWITKLVPQDNYYQASLSEVSFIS